MEEHSKKRFPFRTPPHWLQVTRIARVAPALVLVPVFAAAQGSVADLGPDRIALWYGHSPATRAVSIGLQWDLPWSDTVGARGVWNTSVEAAVGHWRPKHVYSSVTQVGAMPTLRYSFSGNSGLFAEAGIGVNLITPRYETTARKFSTQFQFNESIGLGWRADTWALALRWQHFSNGGIKKPNPGENFAQLHFALDL